jgi:hypothetical protein
MCLRNGNRVLEINGKLCVWDDVGKRYILLRAADLADLCEITAADRRLLARHHVSI